MYAAYGYVLLKTAYKPYPLHESLSMLLTTSGSTGSPKLVRHKYRNLEANAENAAKAFSWTGDEVGICDLPMNYTMGLNVINSHLFAGATVLMVNANLMDPAFWKFIKDERGTSFCGVPFSYEIMRRIGFDRMDLPDLYTLAEGGGRLYPMSRQAASVRECLLDRARRAGAILACAREVTGVEVTGDGAVVSYAALFDEGGATLTLPCTSCVVACGHAPGLAGLGLPLPSRPLTPVLCPIACADETLASLDGRRVHAHLSLEREGETLAEESGEVLMRTYGISGIAAFNLSRHARPGDTIVCDLMAGLGDEDARRIAGRTLKGVLDPAIADALEAETGSREAALRRARAWRLGVTGLAETERAQVMRGGLAVAPFSPASLEASGSPGIFACGEALDVDGPCGGYNLAWAWKSGMVAGTHAAARAARLASGAGARTT